MSQIRLSERPRRNRVSESIRSLVRETSLEPARFILPLFVKELTSGREAIASMPGVDRLSPAEAVKKAERAWSLGIRAVALFPALPESLKDPTARESLNPKGLLPDLVRRLKDRCPELCVITDVAMDPYSSDGHDGLVCDGEILNDETLEILGKMAVAQAKAGADIVAPSDMMDGRVGFIRAALDAEGFTKVGILAYSAKYASSFYGPFREALGSAPRAGDKKTYQMDPANRREAHREARLDIAEGADMIMVKPALAYLDVIADVKRDFDVPVAAYSVSGEYGMIQAAVAAGWLDERRAHLEVLTAIRRAGADMILTYAAVKAAEWLQAEAERK